MKERGGKVINCGENPEVGTPVFLIISGRDRSDPLPWGPN